MNISDRFKSNEADFVGFITEIHILRYVDPIIMFFMSKNSQHSLVLEYIFVFMKTSNFSVIKHVKTCLI